jgi:bacterioferritin B
MGMPSERFIEALQAQISREFAAAHQYTAIGAHYDGKTFPRLASYFYRQADEERAHAMKMVGYLVDSGVTVDFGSVPAPRTSFDDHIAPIQLALEQERSVTVSIGSLFEIARETRDFASESFMQWFVDEQVEEEASVGALLEVAERVREFPMMLEEFLARDADSLGRSSDGG